MGCKKHYLNIFFILPLFIIMSCRSNVKGYDGLPGANNYELFYYSIAIGANSPVYSQKLCNKLSWNGYTTAGFNPKGFQVSYLRSDCFRYLAYNLKNLSFCEEVKPLSMQWLDGSENTKEHCVEEVKSAGPSGSGGIAASPLPDNYEEILKEAGYTRDAMPERYKQDFKEQSEAFYTWITEIRETDEFLQKVDNLPNFNK